MWFVSPIGQARKFSESTRRRSSYFLRSNRDRGSEESGQWREADGERSRSLKPEAWSLEPGAWSLKPVEVTEGHFNVPGIMPRVM